MNEARANARRMELQALRLRLSALSPQALALVTQRVLTGIGYGNVRVVPRGRSLARRALGGVDLLAVPPGEIGSGLALAAVRSYDVERREVDELRGAMLRLAGAQGVLITTERAAASARKAATDYPGRPVRIVDGDELAALAFACGIGMRKAEDVRWEVDERYFERLEAFVSPGQQPQVRDEVRCDAPERWSKKPELPKRPPEPPIQLLLLVTVTLLLPVALTVLT